MGVGAGMDVDVDADVDESGNVGIRRGFARNGNESGRCWDERRRHDQRTWTGSSSMEVEAGLVAG